MKKQGHQAGLRYSKPASPGIAWLRHLRLGNKLLVLSVAFTLPTALLIFFYGRVASDGIDFSAKEICGLAYNQPLRLLAAHIDEPIQAEAALATLASLDSQECVGTPYPQALGVRAEIEDVRARWQQHRMALGGGTGDPVKTGNALSNAVWKTFARVGDTSNLILDPDLDTYYVMDLLVLRHPAAAKAIDRLRLGVDAESLLRLQIQLEGVEQGLATAYSHNDYYPGSRNTLKAALDEPAQAWLKAARALLLAAREGKDFAPSADEANAALQVLYEAANQWEMMALNARIKSLRWERNSVLTLAGLMIFIVGFFALAAGRDTARRLTILVHGARRMAAGELGLRLATEGNDEVASLGTAFNAMATDLSAMYERIEDRVRQRTIELSKRTAQLRLLQTVASAANEAKGAEVALAAALEHLCAFTGWPLGHAYRVEEDRLSSMGLWHIPKGESPRYAAFRDASESLVFKSGEGLLGQVWETGKPQ